MTMSSDSQKSGNFWLGFFVGGLAGAFIIFVLGTKKGKKLAEKLIEEVEEHEEGLEQKVSKLQKKGEAFFKEAESVKERISEEIDTKKQIVSDTLVSKMDEALTKIEDIQRKGVGLTEEVHHRYFKKDGKSLTS